MKNYRLQKNTDSVDIDAKSLGVSAWQIDDSSSLLNSKRGLHIQIRHNKDANTFKAASEIQSLIVAAPEMLEALEMVLAETDDAVWITKISSIINKAKGL